jgi:flap endonuclease-1
MDSLAFGAPILLRGFTSKRNEPITQINLAEVLESLYMTQEQFVDLCILCGCDYSPTIEGIGFTKAVKLMKELHSIEEILTFIRIKGTYKTPEFFPFHEARELFLHPDVNTEITLHWETPDPIQVKDYLVREKGFSQSRVEKSVQRLAAI